MTSKREIEILARRTATTTTPPTVPTPKRPACIVEFATSERWLGIDLFPLQGTLLKLMVGDVAHMTDFDRTAIARWCDGFTLSDDGTRFEGTEGIPPDVWDRLQRCAQTGRAGFFEILAIIGRRGSKGLLGAVLICHLVMGLLERSDPNLHYGIRRGKRLTIFVFAGTHAQAKQNQFRDVAGIIADAECFKPFIAKVTTDSVLLYTPAQLARSRRLRVDDALIEIRAAQTTALAARGPASPMLVLDEFAHVLGAGSTVDSVELYAASTPTLAEFGNDGRIYQSSSPWDRHGQLYASYEQALQVDPHTGQAVHPDKLVIQLPSWSLYEYWRDADTIEMWPGGPTYPTKTGPKVSFDDRLRREQAANPEAFAVEYLAQFRSSLAAYLTPLFVSRFFAGPGGVALTTTTHGRLNVRYVAHADPSKSQANFAYACAHVDHIDGIPHVVFDELTYWSPLQFPNHIVDYQHIDQELAERIARFRLATLTFDQFNSAGSIQRLNALDHPSWRTDVFERTTTAALNWRMYETFKTALGYGIVHAPFHQLAHDELLALEFRNGRIDAPTTGPTRTSDMADAIVNVVWTLLGDQAETVFARLAGLPLGASGHGIPPTPTPSFTHDEDPAAQLSALTTSLGRHALQSSYHNPARGRADYRRAYR